MGAGYDTCDWCENAFSDHEDHGTVVVGDDLSDHCTLCSVCMVKCEPFLSEQNDELQWLPMPEFLGAYREVLKRRRNNLSNVIDAISRELSDSEESSDEDEEEDEEDEEDSDADENTKKRTADKGDEEEEESNKKARTEEAE